MIELNEEVVEETTSSAEETTEQTNEQPVEEVTEKPEIDESKFDSAGNDSVIKVDLSKPPIQPTDNVEKVENNEEELPVMEEVTVEDLKETEQKEVEQIQSETVKAIESSEATGKPLPENIQKLVSFIEETGGDIHDYVKLNRDVSEMDDSDVLNEYYKQTKSHLSNEERSYLLEDSFGVNEDIDDERTIRMKKIALKEQVAEAKAHLDGQKSKYYEEIKAGSKLTEEQKQAIDFFNRSEKQKEVIETNKRTFLNKTDSFFGQDFKGFEYNVGDKKYRFNVKDVNKVKETQSDINNFVSKFTDGENSTIKDAAGYHKSLFTAMNPDAIAKHFYEQGKSDAIKDRVIKDKNINLDPRQTHGETNVGGVKVRVLGESASDMKNRSFKIRKRK
jgi:hypothetical protein